MDDIEKQDDLPASSYELVELLDRLIPPRCIKKGESLEDHLRYAGKRELIDGLLARLKTEAKGVEVKLK